MTPLVEPLRAKLRPFGQEHVLAFWDQLADAERQELADQVRALNLQELTDLFQQKHDKFQLPDRERIWPLPYPPEPTASQRGRAEQALAAGEVAFLVVAGGQGSRLGFEHPKGMFPVGPISNKTLFQIHVEKVKALAQRYGKNLPFLVMTSPATHAETVQFFQEHKFFGMATEDIFFFCQGTMPALDLETGKLLLEEKGRLFLSPNGHGGTLTGLADSGLLERMGQRGIRALYYFQVDNPLVRLADLDFIGQHLAERAEISSKVIAKESPSDKLGNFVLIEGRCHIIEYSDLPEELAKKRDAEGRLELWAGNPAIHLFDIDFLKRVTQGKTRIPWHLARKKVPALDASGNLITPEKENALKFEMFIFDVLPLAERWTIVPTTRPLEFEPLKNATGPDSPETVKAALIRQAVEWLTEAGHTVAAGTPVEISPLFALDADELKAKIKKTTHFDRPTHLQ